MSDPIKEINQLIPENLKKAFRDLKAKFNIPVAPVTPPAAPAQAPTPQALQETTLQDGTVLKYDTPQLAQGSVVTVVGPEGEMNAPEGEHTLADGTKIKVVNKEGKSVVEAIEPAAAPPAPVVQTQTPPSPLAPALITQMKEEFEQKFKAVTEEKETFKTQLTALEKDHKELTGKFNELVIFIEKIVDLPSAKPVEPPKNKHEKSERFINRKTI